MEATMKRVNNNRYTKLIILTILFISGYATCASGARIKDIASFKGVRSNQLVGYGLVIGLNGTGDGNSTQFTTQTLANMMERLGIHTLAEKIKVDNVAGVIVTANLPPFSKKGSTLDVLVSSIGDATSLHGGTLVMTPLKGADNNIYAVAQGALLVGGFASSGGAGGGVQKNHPTVARIPGGAMIERELAFDFNALTDITIALDRPDFTTALRMSDAINNTLGVKNAIPVDAGTVKIKIPETYAGNHVTLVSSLEQIEIQPDMEARIVLSERTGTVIMGEKAMISPIAIAHGNLSVEIKEKKDVSQPAPFSDGETVVTPDTEVNVTEENNKLLLVSPEKADIGSVVKALNAIGVSPRDLITVFQAIKASGALQAELEII
ncbi:MAG: flagellar basal body P-ring protein FlgI [Deltaproteobacteria bacterium]|nr:flagellar basal body P-ring protein FlgI [Deltaproteobacteria bacterium]